MSRYRLDWSAFDIVVGWDAAVQSFFYNVTDNKTNPREPHLITMKGSAPGELPTVDALLAVMGHDARLVTPEIQAKLEQDRKANPQPTPLQQTLARLMSDYA